MINIADTWPPPIEQDWIFYVVALLIIVSALGVVALRSVIHAALAMGACFSCIGAYYVLMHAQFLAVAQVLVYVGDVTVLILFAVMLTRGVVRTHLERWGVPIGAGVGVALLVAWMLIDFLWHGVVETPGGAATATIQSLGSYGIVRAFSREMLTTYLLPFEVASGILLMALVGAIVLAREERPDDPA